MAKLIALDDGHGMETLGKETPFIPELGRKIKENEFNRAVVAKAGEELTRCGFDVLYVAEGDSDVPLKTRTDLANNKIKNKFNRMADAYVSFHYDALDASFEGKDASGHTVFFYPNSVTGQKLATCIDKYLDGGTQQVDRNIKSADFHVLRETKMVAVLSENGFMDNKREAMLMLDANFIQEVAIEHAKGICEYFGVAYVPFVSVEQQPTVQPVIQPSNPVALWVGCVNANSLNVRSQPNADSTIIKTLPKSAIVGVYEEISNGWLKVDNIGYVNGKYITRGTIPVQQPTPAPIPQPVPVVSTPEPVKYRVYANGRWYGWIESYDENPKNSNGYAGSEGTPIMGIQIQGEVEYQVHANGKWYSWIKGYNEVNDMGYAGTLKHAIDAIRIKGKTYRVSNSASTGYYNWVTDFNTINGNGYAGDFGHPIDKIQIK